MLQGHDSPYPPQKKITVKSLYYNLKISRLYLKGIQKLLLIVLGWISLKLMFKASDGGSQVQMGNKQAMSNWGSVLQGNSGCAEHTATPPVALLQECLTSLLKRCFWDIS